MEELNVLYACDNNYAPYCGVSMHSLLVNNIGIDQITVYIVIDSVSDDNKKKMQETANAFGRDIVLIDAESVKHLMEELGVPKYRGSYVTHYRKFFQMLIPETVHKLLYLDADTIVTGSLEELLKYDLQDKCMGVVLDTLGGHYKKLLGFKYNEPYFNAGVTWIDVDKWKERDYSQKLMEHIKNVRAKYCNPDQDLFNLVLRGDTFVLPIGYNFQPAHRAYSDRSYFANYPRDYYTVEEIQAARENPVILHTYRFLGEFPWHKGNLHPDNAIFDKYLEQSEWEGYEKKKASVSTVLKIEKLMYRYMPKAVFLRFFQFALYQSFAYKNKQLLKEK